MPVVHKDRTRIRQFSGEVYCGRAFVASLQSGDRVLIHAPISIQS
jgi:hypothetical protein